MSDSEHVAARGACYTIEWAVAANGKSPAMEFFEEELNDAEQAKVQALFQRLADTGRIWNEEQFKNLGKRAGSGGRGLFEFKRFQIRFLGDFRPDQRFVIAVGVRKKKSDLHKSDIERAVQILAQHDQRKRGLR